jgi:hypothetical protein
LAPFRDHDRDIGIGKLAAHKPDPMRKVFPDGLLSAHTHEIADACVGE